MTMPADTVLEAEAVDLESQAAKIRLWKQGTPAPTPTPIPTPAPDAAYPGARNMSSVFKKQLVMTEFPTLAAEGGAFLQAYTDWDGYPTSYQTTSKKGYYEPKNVSVVDTADGYRVQQCRLKPGSENSNGKPSGTAMFPKAAQGSSLSLDMMVRLPNMVPGWHIANLMWPISEKWPSDGEFDFLEFNTGSRADVAGFYHWMNGTKGGDQTGLASSVAAGDWFTVGFEVISGQSAKWFVNGLLIASITGAHVTTDIMREVGQNEDGGNPTKEQLVQYNWIRAFTTA
jgi:hypothetical protein